jgi:tetratricopeptide (TPR) repeat protein
VSTFSISKRLLAGIAISALLSAQPRPLDAAWEMVAKGDRQGAVRVLERMIAADPRNGEARLLLGSILTEAGKGRESIEQLAEATRLMPKSAEAHNALGEAFNAVGDSEAARASFAKAVSADPKFAQARLNLGQALLQSGETEAAAEHLDRAIAIFGAKPDAALAQYLRAKIFLEQDHPDKAAALLQQAVALQPDFPEAWSDLGQAKLVLLDEAGALTAFRRSVELDPENPISRYRLGAAYLREGKAHEAVAHLKESFRLMPDNQSTLYSLQSALREDGQAEEAARVKAKLTELLRNIDKESQSAFAALRLNNDGAALEKNGDLKGAFEKYRSAVTLDPSHAGIRLNYGVMLLRFGKWQEGLGQLREAVKLDPRNVAAKAALRDALEQAPVEFGGNGRTPPTKK